MPLSMRDADVAQLVEQLIRKKLTKVYLVGFLFFLTRSVLDERQFAAFWTHPFEPCLLVFTV
jgi:hypothetical protein